MKTPLALVVVALGGAAGTYARVAVSLVFPDPALAATLAVNLVGALALGFLLTWLAGGGTQHDGTRIEGRRRQRARLLLGTGFCGGFTTYSLIALQAASLVQSGDAPVAVLYCAATVALGAVATMIGIVLASRRRPDRTPSAS
ncbi:CrcB family protein [Rhodococcus sp. IEGM 1408]|uniref:fluoride efflux transporter FluC n=1 Tax=Rhodococcus sp. IEGM 1408 TaxID=3082220 RepID=UPI002954F9B4|nr:CrcB family protein [Rhodococcus sp. IEGM 1408]MDV8001994.1 CrcB family protein [Rhodococcus sp. IEGM 1408]